jgi:hypothetical protein
VDHVRIARRVVIIGVLPLAETIHPEMRATDCADAGIPTIVDDLTPTHRMEATVGDITHLGMKQILGIDIVAHTLLVIVDTADTAMMTTHRNVGGAEDMMTMATHRNVGDAEEMMTMTTHRDVGGAEDMVTMKTIREIGSVVVVEMIGITLRGGTGNTPLKIQAGLLDVVVVEMIGITLMTRNTPRKIQAEVLPGAIQVVALPLIQT